MENKEYLEFRRKKIEKEDLKFKNSKKRKDLKWIIKCYVQRKLITEHGILKFKITKYYEQTPNGDKIHYFDNKYLKENKFQRVDKDLQDKAKQLHFLGLSSNEISRNFNYAFTGRTMLNFKSKTFSEEKEINYQDLSKNKEYLYIDIDDCYLDTRKNRKVKKNRFRTITMHLGFENNKPKNIIGKTIILEPRNLNDRLYKNPLEWSVFLENKIKNIYGDHLKIIVCGDGVKWIKKIAHNLNGKYILDHFHIKQKGFNVLGYNLRKNKKNYLIFNEIEKELQTCLYKLFSEYVDKFELSKVIKLLEYILDNYQNRLAEKKVIEISDFIKYLTNNLDAEGNYSRNEGYIGTHTETWISHHVKKKTKQKFTIFSLKSIINIFNFYQNDNLRYLII